MLFAGDDWVEDHHNAGLQGSGMIAIVCGVVPSGHEGSVPFVQIGVGFVSGIAQSRRGGVR